MQVIAGFGFRGSAGLDSLRDALHRTAQSHRLTALATPADKAETASHSPRVQQLRKTGSVAEAAALSAAGTGARLISTRQVSHDRTATCAVAEGGT
jgi:cobalt-precorrin 5A hydrolase